MPARHAPVAVLVPVGRHAAAQRELSSGASPCVRQVEPAPPHIDCSTACEGLSVQPSVQKGVDPPVKQSSAPHAGSGSPVADPVVQTAPAREPVPVEEVWQRPAAQVCPVAQRTPQTPQLARSVLVSTQAAPHIVRGAAQVLPPKQRPIEQV